jgi:hypothetical protein
MHGCVWLFDQELDSEYVLINRMFIPLFQPSKPVTSANDALVVWTNREWEDIDKDHMSGARSCQQPIGWIFDERSHCPIHSTLQEEDHQSDNLLLVGKKVGTLETFVSWTIRMIQSILSMRLRSLPVSSRGQELTSHPRDADSRRIIMSDSCHVIYQIRLENRTAHQPTAYYRILLEEGSWRVGTER